MILINRIINKESVHYYNLTNSPDIHGKLIGFFSKLNFDEDELLELDTPFTEMNGEFIFIQNDWLKAYFVIGVDDVVMVLDSTKSQSDLTDIMKNYFIFPR